MLPVPEIYLVADDSNDSENVFGARRINHSVDVSTEHANCKTFLYDLVYFKGFPQVTLIFFFIIVKSYNLNNS